MRRSNSVKPIWKGAMEQTTSRQVRFMTIYFMVLTNMKLTNYCLRRPIEYTK